MTNHDVHSVLDLCEQALSRRRDERAAFLDKACGSDPDLRHAVESLLAEETVCEGFLKTPVWVASVDALFLKAGTRLGPYEILAFVGAGGNGDVYKARDTRLGRVVAIKVLRPHLAATDPDHRRRFEREARAASALDDPHICTLYDIGSEGGADYLVLEFLDGQTIAERLAKGPLPIRQALEYGIQIAEGLAKAHRQGIVHHDLKPANVMVTASGVKLLDFGVAKLKPPALVTAANPTARESGSSAGSLMGTLPYMAPEQLEGSEGDARSDIFSIGAVLYEMIAGCRAFDGDTGAAIAGAILERDPAPLSSIQPRTPAALERLVRRCLAKHPDIRWQSAADLSDALRWIADASDAAVSTSAERRRRRGLLPLALLATGALAIAVVWLLQGRPLHPAVVRLSLDVSPASELNAGTYDPRFARVVGGSATAIAWTPDGQALVFIGQVDGVRRIFIRRLDAAEARPLDNTDGARLVAVSPDNEWVAFWTGAEPSAGAIRKVSFRGGPAMDLARGVLVCPRGLAWDDSGRILFGQEDGPIAQVSSDGGQKAVTTLLEGEVRHVLPSPLPGGRALIYTVRKRLASWGDDEIVVQRFATGERKGLLRDAVDARYIPTGHLVFLRRGVLFAVPFDPERIELLGKEVPVLETVAQALTAGTIWDLTGAGQYAVSSTGVLAWVPGTILPYSAGRPAVIDRAGRMTPLHAPASTYSLNLSLSPDGRRLALKIAEITGGGLWVLDIERGTLTPLNRGGEAGSSTWSPDGRFIAFRWVEGGRQSVAMQPSDGSAPPSVLATGSLVPNSFTPDGKYLLATEGSTHADIVVVAIGDGGTVHPLIATPNQEQWPTLSPDGQWLAYGSDVSGQDEVYVRPYPGSGPVREVSLDGGDSPAWNPNGRELFFVTPADAGARRHLMAVDFSPGPPAQTGSPHELFAFPPRDVPQACQPARCYEVAPDGRHFYFRHESKPPSIPPPVTHVNVVLNWFEDLTTKVGK